MRKSILAATSFPWHSPLVDDTSNTGHIDGAASEPADSPFPGVELRFPVTFDLRIIYLKAEGRDIVDDLDAIYRSRSVACTLMQGADIPGSKYARMGSRLTFTSREQMYGTYEDIGKLPYVRSAI